MGIQTYRAQIIHVYFKPAVLTDIYIHAYTNCTQIINCNQITLSLFLSLTTVYDLLDTHVMHVFERIIINASAEIMAINPINS